MANWVITIGLVLDIIGVFLIWKFELGKGLPVEDSDGKAHMLPLGNEGDRTPVKKFLAGIGLPLIMIGFLLQILGVWID